MKQIAAVILNFGTFLQVPNQKRFPLTLSRILIAITLLILFAAEILRIYFIMPFPGSQQNNTVFFAYWLGRSIVWIRIFGLAIVSLAAIITIRSGRRWEKISLSAAVLGYVVTFYLFNFRFEADKIFLQPGNKAFLAATVSDNDKTKLVIGLVINGQAKAYPIQYIGYHHQVMDTVGNTPVMITYCTVCRTGRAFSPLVHGRLEKFRLVGMDHFNAVFEDASTGSWWQQATGEAIAGPRKGSTLKEFASRQATLDVWLRQYPESLIMQPDSVYDDNYFKLEDYDRGTMQSELVRRNYFSWKPKSWVIGVKNELGSRVYDWNELVKKRIIQDSVSTLPIVVALENDTTSFHVFDRRVNGSTLQFRNSTAGNVLVDDNTSSTWSMDGLCIAGSLKGQQLQPLQAYNEFWHSWQTFQSNIGYPIYEKSRD